MDTLLRHDLWSTHNMFFLDFSGKDVLSSSESEEEDELLEM